MVGEALSEPHHKTNAPHLVWRGESKGSTGRTRTCNPAVNSRTLYH
jgi:hypothetical protein